MLQPRICLLGLLPFRPIIRIGCRPAPAECGLDRPAARARQIAGVRMTRLHGSAVLGSVRLSLERGDLEPGPVGAPGTSTACLVVSSPRRLPWASKDARTSPTSSSLRGPLRVKRVTLTARRSLPVFPCEQTSAVSVGMSQRCHKQTNALQQKTSLFDQPNLVRDAIRQQAC